MELLGRGLNRADNLVIARASAEIVREAEPDIVFGGVGVLVEQCFGGHQKARRADAALQSGAFEEALLKGVEMALGSQSFDGLQGGTLSFHREDDATVHWHAVHDDRAGSAVAIIATFLGTGQAQLVPENFEETLARFAEEFSLLAVYGGGDVMLFRAGGFSWHGVIVIIGALVPWRWRACVE
jgi:hypothetical protein